MSHDENRSPRFIHLPGKQDAICDRRSLNPQQIEKALRHTKVLRPPTLQADAARTGIAGKSGAQELAVLAGSCDPMKVRLFSLVVFHNADAGTVGSAKLDSSAN